MIAAIRRASRSAGLSNLRSPRRYVVTSRLPHDAMGLAQLFEDVHLQLVQCCWPVFPDRVGVPEFMLVLRQMGAIHGPPFFRHKRQSGWEVAHGDCILEQFPYPLLLLSSGASGISTSVRAWKGLGKFGRSFRLEIAGLRNRRSTLVTDAPSHA